MPWDGAIPKNGSFGNNYLFNVDLVLKEVCRVLLVSLKRFAWQHFMDVTAVNMILMHHEGKRPLNVCT